MNEKIIGGAIIGFGGMGHYHATKMQTVEGIELIGVYDINLELEKDAKENNIFFFKSQEELLANKAIDLIVIATPNDFHKEIAIAALKAGKNVISEKPVTMNSLELNEIIEVANKCNKLFSVHQNRRWDEDYLTIKKLYDNNELGNIFRIESRVQGSRGIPAGWREEAKHGGGMILDWGVHLLDQMLMMMGDRKLLTVSATTTNITNDECDDGFTAFCRFEGNLEWIVEVGTCNFIQMPRWVVFGDSGSAIIRDWECNGEVVKIFTHDDDDVAPVVAGAGITKTMAPRNEVTTTTNAIEKVEADWKGYYKNIINYLNGKEDYLITHAQQRRLMKLLELIFEAAKTHKVLDSNI